MLWIKQCNEISNYLRSINEDKTTRELGKVCMRCPAGFSIIPRCLFFNKVIRVRRVKECIKMFGE